MSSTNKTANVELSQFLGTDKPAWLTDYNADMQKIDVEFKKVEDNQGGSTVEIQALKDEDVRLQGELDLTNQNVQDLADSDITMSNRVTTLEGNYETIHHEVVVAQEGVDTLRVDVNKNANDITDINTFVITHPEVTNANIDKSRADFSTSLVTNGHIAQYTMWGFSPLAVLTDADVIISGLPLPKFPSIVSIAGNSGARGMAYINILGELHMQITEDKKGLWCGFTITYVV